MTGTRWLSLVAVVVLIPTLSGGSSSMHPLLVTYWPPEYIGGDSALYEEPDSVRGIEGGTVQIVGRGDLEGVTGSIGENALFVQPHAIGWMIMVRMPAARAVVDVEDGMEGHTFVLEPVRDSLPVVTLLDPARDTVVRSAHGQIHLVAQVSDDHGVAEAYFEVTPSRTGRLGALPARRVKGAAQRLDVLLNLDGLKLKPGDVLKLRAVARDYGDSVRGPGVSETRTLRVDTASATPR